MGTTIDELVETAQKYNCMIVTKDMWNTAIGMSHKLQKIEQIIAVWHQDIYAKDFECIAEVAEVIEDGSDS